MNNMNGMIFQYPAVAVDKEQTVSLRLTIKRTCFPYYMLRLIYLPLRKPQTPF
jgi:hypothetical protein